VLILTAVWAFPLSLSAQETPAPAAETAAPAAGQQKGYDESYRGVVHEVNLLKKVELQIAVNDEYLEPTIKAIVEGAHTGKIGDGKIFVTTIEETIRIRTGERGKDAIG
jgi:nitrogen regulatory protein P-II 1